MFQSEVVLLLCRNKFECLAVKVRSNMTINYFKPVKREREREREIEREGMRKKVSVKERERERVREREV